MRKGADFTDVALTIKENLAGPISFLVATVTSIYFFSNQYPTYVAPGAVAGVFADNWFSPAEGVKVVIGGDATAIVGFVIAAVLYWVLRKALKSSK
jgi:hypothetical protein